MTRVLLGALVWLFPRRWRARYGPELIHLVEEERTAGQSAWRIGGDLVAAAAAERARELGLIGSGVTRAARVTGGCLAVFWAWTAFVVAGAVVQKSAEHWQGAVPAGARTVPATAFAVLIAGAALAGVTVLVGIALALPRIRTALADGGLRAVRGPVVWAGVLSLVTGAGMLGLAVWAHRLSVAQRNGADHRYGIAFLVWAAIAVAALIAWTGVAARIARRVEFGRRMLVAEAAAAVGVTVAMAGMTFATLVWWHAVAVAAPGFLASGPLALAGAVMVAATLVGAGGSRRAVRELRRS